MAKSKEIDLTDSATDEQEETGDELSAVMAELGGKGILRWNIYCLAPKEKYGHVATWETGEEISLARIAKEFGAGEFRVRGFDEKGRVAGGKNVKISTLLEAKAKRDDPVPTPQPGLGMMEMLTFMSTMQASQQAASRDMISQMMQTQMQAMQSQTALLTAVLGRAQPSSGLDGPALIGMMSAMKDMVKPADNNGVETLLKGLELGRSLEGNGGDGTDFLSIAAKGLDVIGNVVKNSNAAKARPPVPHPRKPVQIRVVEPNAPLQVKPPAEQSPQPPAEQPRMTNKIHWLKMQATALCVQASRDKDPNLYAAVFVDNIPQDIEDEEVLERFSPEDAVSQLAIVEPRVAQYAPWFEKFRLAVIEQLTDGGGTDEAYDDDDDDAVDSDGDDFVSDEDEDDTE